VVLAACGASAALVPSRVAAAESDGEVGIAWEAPSGCPDREVIVRRVSDALADATPGLGAGWQVHGRVQPGRVDGWVLVLELRSPHAAPGAPAAERTLSARDCDDLGEAAAVAIAIALDDASKEREGATSDAVPVGVAASEGGSRGAAADPVPDRAASAEVAAERTREPVRLAVAADGVLDSASLGGLGWGASLEVSGWWRRFGVGGYGLWLAPRATELGSGQQAEFSLLGGGLRLCHRAPADWLWVSPCLGAELASFGADSAGLRAGRDVSDLWFAGTASVAFGSRVLGALGVHSRVELVLPIGRQEYLVDDQVLHSVPAATLRWLVGIDAGGG